ncbi:382_t:CDS:2, partial [Gigaspora rosea]
NDELAHTTRLKKCKGCQINEGSNSDNLQCILRRQLRSKKRALQNNWVKKGKEVGEFFLEIPLESLDGKRNKVQITGDRPHIDGQHLSAIEIATREEELISIHLEESQAVGELRSLTGQIREVISIERARKVANLTGKKKEAKKEEKEGITKDNKRKPKEAEEKAKTDLVRKRRKGKEKQTPHSEA